MTITPTPISDALVARRARAVPRGVGVFNTVTVERASGAILTDLDGRSLIDFAGGIGVVNAGHCPESVVSAICEQAGKLLHASFNVATYEPYVALCEKLIELLPHGGATKAMLVSTGAEAVENAVKIARQATGRQGVLCFTDAFHGRTLMALTLTSKVAYKRGCGPFAPEVYRQRFPNYYRFGEGLDLETFVARELKSLERTTYTSFDPAGLAAVIIEPVQGEGGFNPAPPAYLRGLREFCDRYGILLIFDEVQSGFGRTGDWASWQGVGVVPDISTYAKSLGSGMPIAAVVGSAEVMDAAAPSTIGGTYIGNPVCCAAALATIEVMQRENLNARAIQVGEIIDRRFRAMARRFPAIGDVRGVGAMRALELVKNSDPLQPDGDLCRYVVTWCAAQGLVLLSAGTDKNIIRVLCPLVIADDELIRGLDIIEAALENGTKQ